MLDETLSAYQCLDGVDTGLLKSSQHGIIYSL